VNVATHILYVEDDPNSREIMALLLTHSLGVQQLNLFEDSTDFWQRLTALPTAPTLILLDIHMKPLTGFDMLALLRADSRFAKTPVIALTASVMNEEIVKLRAAGFNGVIAKPIDLDTFPSILQAVLSGQDVWGI
jgi:CheY-like chemotaxis protein